MAFSSWSKKLNPHRQTLRQQILNDPYYRFRSLEEIAIAEELGLKIEVSQASVDDFLRLPGLSIHQARTLVDLIKMGVQLLSLEDMAAALSIPVQRLKPFAPILAFSYFDPESLLSPQRVNLNIATVEQLQEIPGLNLFLAEQIIKNRQENGFYKSLADLQKRLDLDGQMVSQLMHYLQL